MIKASGHKNKRIIICVAVIVVLIVCVVFVCISSADKRKGNKPDYSLTDPAFVDFFSNEDDIESMHVSSLNSYYLDGLSYYVVEFTKDGSDWHYKLLYILIGPGKIRFYPISDESECYIYFPDEYKAFLNAKKYGIARNYSSEEIAEIINSFYGRKIVE